MAKKKGNNNNNKQQQQQQAAAAPVTEEVVVATPVVAEKQTEIVPPPQPVEEESSVESPTSAGESTAASPPASPNVATTATTATTTSSAFVGDDKVPYTIVPTPKEETAVQRIAGFYRRRERHERTAAEAKEEEAHEARLASLQGEAREVAVRSWSHKPAHLLLDVAFMNMEKFTRNYIEAEYDAFCFMLSTDAQRERAATLERVRSNRAAIDNLSSEEMTARTAVRRETREAYTSILLQKDTERRAILAAEREARRQARHSATPSPLPAGTDSEDNYDSVTMKTEEDANSVRLE